MLYTNYNDTIILFKFLLGVVFMIQGGKEYASLTWSNFQSLTVTSCKYLGCIKLEIVNLQDKSMSMLVKNPTCSDNTGRLDVVACTKNKHTCVVHLCPPTQEQFYCYKTINKLLKVFFSNNFCFT